MMHTYYIGGMHVPCTYIYHTYIHILYAGFACRVLIPRAESYAPGFPGGGI